MCVFETVGDVCRSLAGVEDHAVSQDTPCVLTAMPHHLTGLEKAFTGTGMAVDVRLNTSAARGVSAAQAHLFDYRSWAPPSAAQEIARDLDAGRLVLFVPGGMAWFDRWLADALLNSAALRIELHDMPFRNGPQKI